MWPRFDFRDSRQEDQCLLPISLMDFNCLEAAYINIQ